MILFRANGILNMFWTYLFFARHVTILALIGVLVLAAITRWLIALLWRPMRRAAVLLGKNIFVVY